MRFGAGEGARLPLHQDGRTPGGECRPVPYHTDVTTAGASDFVSTPPAPEVSKGGGADVDGTDWRVFVQIIARQQIEAYIREPMELVSHANREAGALDGYRGRQILELLQNADDAGEGFASPRLLLRISRKGLIAANAGQLFSERGVKSLVISDASPKQLAQNRFIGCKGLGFRSVLTWTRAPVVLSGQVRIAFDAAHADAVIRSLMREHGTLAAEVEGYSRRFGRLPVPVMRFPRWAPEELVNRLGMESLLKADFQTVIGIPFADGPEGDRAYDDALSQLKSLSPDALLFCRHLESVVFEGDAGGAWDLARERVESGADRVLISVPSGTRLWNVHRRTGRIPEEAIPSATNVSRDFELAVAVPAEPIDAKEGALCVFFPTQERLPTQVRLHATLELTENRNRLIDHASNRHVLTRLAELLAVVVENEADQHGGARAVELIDGLQDADPELVTLGFRDACVMELGKRRLVPRIGGDVARPKDARKPPDEVWLSILDSSHFPELLSAAAARLTGLLGLFEVGWYDSAELTSRLQKQLAEAGAEEAGAIVGRLLARQRLSGVKLGDLVLDTEGRFVGADGRCFLHPTAATGRLDVPAWAGSVRFLDAAFQAALSRTSGAPTLRALSDRLGQYGAGVDEYRLDTVARALIAAVPVGLDAADRESLRGRWRELVGWLFKASGENRDLLAKLPIQVLGKSGELRPADSMYLGEEYPKGRVLERFFKSVPNIEFVGGPAAIGLSGTSPPEAQAFLEALGVMTSPEPGGLGGEWEGKYRKFMFAQQSFPVAVRGTVCDTPGEIRSACRDYEVRGLDVPEHLAEVLTGGDAAGVVAFFLGDGSHLLASELADGAMFWASVPREWSVKPEPNVRVPNAVLWLLREVPWIPCADHVRRRPREIILSEAGARLFTGVFWKHSIDPADPVLRDLGGADALTAFLMRLGAVASLEDVSEETLFGLLTRLPESDPGGKTAGRIYSTLVESGMKPGSSAVRDRFCAEGKVWCRSGAYLPVQSARYNSNLALPAPVERELALIDIPRRRNGKVIEAIFGVRTLQSDEVTLELNAEDTRFDGSSELANQALRRAVPYIYALRLHKRADEDGRERSLLTRMNVRVCEQAAVTVNLPDDEPRQLLLSQKGERIAIGTDLYVVAHYDPDGRSVGRFWQWIASLISEVLGSDIAAEVGLVLRGKNADEMAEVVCDLIGEGGEDKLAEARSRIAEPEEPAPPHEYTLPTPSDPEGNKTSGGDAALPKAGEQDAPGPDAPAPGNPGDKGFVVEPGEAPGSRKPSPRKLVVAPGPIGPGTRSGLVAPESVTFRVVEAFEQLADPPRYPICVSHVRGLEGLGCDYVSVTSEEVRARILAAGKLEDADVVRYIEVKGSGSKAGKIELEGNERRRAEEARGRYFVYRVFVDVGTPDRYEVGVLADPLNSEGVQYVPRVSLAVGSGAQWFQVSEVEIRDDPAM